MTILYAWCHVFCAQLFTLFPSKGLFTSLFSNYVCRFNRSTVNETRFRRCLIQFSFLIRYTSNFDRLWPTNTTSARATFHTSYLIVPASGHRLFIHHYQKIYVWVKTKRFLAVVLSITIQLRLSCVIISFLSRVQYNYISHPALLFAV